jgi:PKD repeat protein
MKLFTLPSFRDVSCLIRRTFFFLYGFSIAFKVITFSLLFNLSFLHAGTLTEARKLNNYNTSIPSVSSQGVLPTDGPASNLPPVVFNELIAVCEGSVFNGTILNGDYDPDGNLLYVSPAPFLAPLHGTLTLNGTGDFVYTANPGYTGSDMVIIGICDDPGPAALCTNDTIFISIDTLIQANAGIDQELCDLVSTSLTGNDPIPGLGQWNLISGANSPVITMTGTSTAQADGILANPQPYLFSFVITNGACISQDTVTVTDFLPPSTSFAGYDQYLCSEIPAVLTLDANTPVAGTGHWTYIFGAGPVTIVDPFNPDTEVLGLIPGTYLFDWTIGNGTCETSSSAVFIQVAEQVQAFAGNDTILCPGQSGIDLLTATAAAYIDLDWTSSGSGNFSDPLALNPTYFPSNDDIESGMVTLTLSVSGNFPCGTAVDEIILSFGNSTFVNAGPDDQLLPGQTAYELSAATATSGLAISWNSSGDGTFENNEALNTTYYPGSNDLLAGTITLTISSNGPLACEALSDAMVLEYSEGVNGTAGPDAFSCGEAYTITSASAVNYSSLAWSHNGAGTLSNENTLNPAYHPAIDEAGQVILTLNLIGLGPAFETLSDQMTLTIRYPKAMISGSASICASDSASLRIDLEGSAPWSVTISDGSSNQEITGITETPIFVKVKPVNTTVYHLEGVGDLYCQPSSNHVTGSAVISLLNSPLAQFNAQDQCSGTVVHFQDVSQSESAITWYWNFDDPASGNANISLEQHPEHLFNNAGTYLVHLSVTNSEGCSDLYSDTLVIMSLPDATYSYSTHHNSHKVDFRPEGNTAENLINNYLWDFGDGHQHTSYPGEEHITHEYETAGSFNTQLLVSGKNGCISQSQQTVNLGTSPSLTLEILNPEICVQSEVTASVNYSANFTHWIIEWGDGTEPRMESAQQTDVKHQYSQAGTYQITARIVASDFPILIADSISYQVKVNPSPVAGFSISQYCLGQETVFINESVNSDLSTGSFVWNFGENGAILQTTGLQQPTFRYSEAGIYEVSLIVANATGCADTLKKNIEIINPPAAFFSTGAACAGQVLQLKDESAEGSSDINAWSWEIFQDGLRLTSDLQHPDFKIETEGKYNLHLSISDSKGCTSERDSIIQVAGFPISAFSIEENFGHEQGRVKFNNGSLGGTNYLWDFGNGFTSTEASPVVSFYEDGNYNIRLISVNASGCSDTAEIQHNQLFKALYIPNAVAPGNSDPMLAQWMPKGENLATYRVEVYNRWNELQWSSEQLNDNGSPAESWDGTYNGIPCPEGIYIWRIQAFFTDGTAWENEDIGKRENMPNLQQGTITLLR